MKENMLLYLVKVRTEFGDVKIEHNSTVEGKNQQEAIEETKNKLRSILNLNHETTISLKEIQQIGEENEH